MCVVDKEWSFSYTHVGMIMKFAHTISQSYASQCNVAFLQITHSNYLRIFSRVVCFGIACKTLGTLYDKTVASFKALTKSLQKLQKIYQIPPDVQNLKLKCMVSNWPTTFTLRWISLKSTTFTLCCLKLKQNKKLSFTKQV